MRLGLWLEHQGQWRRVLVVASWLRGGASRGSIWHSRLRGCVLCPCKAPSSRAPPCFDSLQLFRGRPSPSEPCGGGTAVAVAVRGSAGPDLVGAAPLPGQVLFSCQPESL